MIYIRGITPQIRYDECIYVGRLYYFILFLRYLFIIFDIGFLLLLLKSYQVKGKLIFLYYVRIRSCFVQFQVAFKREIPSDFVDALHILSRVTYFHENILFNGNVLLSLITI